MSCTATSRYSDFCPVRNFGGLTVSDTYPKKAYFDHEWKTVSSLDVRECVSTRTPMPVLLDCCRLIGPFEDAVHYRDEVLVVLVC
jgi:hypothetical protein